MGPLQVIFLPACQRARTVLKRASKERKLTERKNAPLERPKDAPQTTHKQTNAETLLSGPQPGSKAKESCGCDPKIAKRGRSAAPHFRGRFCRWPDANEMFAYFLLPPTKLFSVYPFLSSLFAPNDSNKTPLRQLRETVPASCHIAMLRFRLATCTVREGGKASL